MDLLNALQWRYAVKQFSDKKIPSNTLKTLLDSARLSASSYGLQPYKIIVIESKAIRNRLVPFSYDQDKVAQSSHLLILAAHTNIGDTTVDSYINKHAQITSQSVDSLSNFSTHMKSALSQKSPVQKQEWANQQAYIALGNILTCAAAMKIDSCPMTGIDSAGYDSVLGLDKQNLATTVICPIGYRSAEDLQAQTPKVRFDYDDIILEL